MNDFNKKDFIDFIMNNKVVGFKDPPTTLNSGRKSSWYANWRNVSEDVFLLDELTDYILAFTRSLGLEPDTFHGVREGATKLGIITQYKWAKQSQIYVPGSHSLSMGRGKYKDHGDQKDRYFLGIPKNKTIVLEDVTTTSLSLLEEVVKVKETGEADIIAALSLTNRLESTPVLGADSKESWDKFTEVFEKLKGEEFSYNGNMSVEQAFAKLGIPFYALSTAREVLPEAFRRLKPNDNILRELKKQLDNPILSLVSYSELIGQNEFIQEKHTVFGSS
ncbi:hypothetical protein HYX17_00460 [Candidatus Woesearchaeota archaeon]|nr:hypothetical protein [Candidatus Woesearchaeota archaeon]